MPEIQANRNFLAQLYHSLDLQIANTFFAQPADRLVTYFEIAASAMDEIKDNKFAQMDFIVCGSTCTTDMTDIYSMRHLAFASHHFLLYCEMESGFALEKRSKRKETTAPKLEYSVLRDPDLRQNFTEAFKVHLQSASQPRNIDEALLNINISLKSAVRDYLPQ